MGFSVKEFRDLDLLLKLRESGPIKSKELAGELGADEFGSHLGRRLGWMGHYGMVERLDSGEWSLTDGGKRVAFARSRAALISDLSQLPEEELIEVMAAVTARWRRGDPMIASMLRREFIFGTQR
jgi:hypothetical protein